MRIDRLDLVAFGLFTGMSLDLSAPGVHLVTGPNEAGKSTALHALDQLLYGIDVRSPYDFVHAKGALRLGALIRRSDGGILEFVRSKARNTPLLGPDGSAVGQAELDTALGGIDRTTFRSVFALTSAELRRGGEELVHGGGDFRQALTASHSGLRLSETLRAIDERMAELYKQQGRRPVINMRIAELRRVLERQRAALLRPEEYARREREVAEAEEALARLAGELKEARREESRLERLSQALPALDRRRILLSRIEEVRGEGVLAPQEAADRLPGLLEELGNARSTLDDARRRLASTTDEMSRLVVDEDLLAVEGTIESLFQDHRDARSAARRLAKSAGDAAEARRTAEALLRQVHPDARFEDAARYDVPRSVRKRAQELHDRHTELETALARDRRAAGRLRRKLEEAEKELSGLPAAEETGPLRAVLAAIPDDLLSRMVADDEEERRLRGAVEQGLRDLKLGARPEAEAGGVTVPSEAEIGAHAEALDELKRDRRDLARRTKELARRLDADRLELAGLLNVDPPPTGDDLAAARSDRDALWREIRDGCRERVEEFTPAVARADHLADRLRQEADRVAKRYRLELQIGEGERELAECAGEESELDRRAEKLTGEWARLWEDFAGPRPASPKAAPAVLRAAERLREDADRLAAVRAGLASRREQASQHIARLREVLRVTGEASSLGADNALAELPELRELAETSLSRQERAAREHAALADRVTTARDELAEAEAQVAQGEHELDVWRADWDGLLARAGLAAGLETAEAVTRLESLEQVSAAVRSAARSDREMEQDTAVVERFHASLERVARECGRRLPDAEAERYGFVADLHREAQENRSAADRRAHLQAGHATLEADVDHHLRTTADLDAELAALVGKAGVADAEALGEAVRRRRRHTELAATLAEVTATLPVKEDALRALEREASDTDPGHLHADLEDLADRIGDLDRERAEHSALLGERRSLLAQLDGSAEAAQAAEDAETAAAALVEESEEYLRLRVAREIVTSCMEKYRQEQQDPILTRASALFRRLTLGGYAGLELDEDRDSPVVLARRGDRPLQVEQLSEGTRDQLYLALRLASLERYAEEGHTLPFVVDDIFMTFDDQRTRATLRVLEEMADRFQMIVFTHHDHLAELARAELPEGRLHLHPLPRFRPFV